MLPSARGARGILARVNAECAAGHAFPLHEASRNSSFVFLLP